MSAETEKSKIIVDEDWKAQVQAEKEGAKHGALKAARETRRKASLVPRRRVRLPKAPHTRRMNYSKSICRRHHSCSYARR